LLFQHFQKDREAEGPSEQGMDQRFSRNWRGELTNEVVQEYAKKAEAGGDE
jgi:hypothetical protein